MLLRSSPSPASRIFGIARSPPAPVPVWCCHARRCQGLLCLFRHRLSKTLPWCQRELQPSRDTRAWDFGFQRMLRDDYSSSPRDGAKAVAFCSWAQGHGWASPVAAGGAALAGPAPLLALPCPWLIRAPAGWRAALLQTLGSSEWSPRNLTLLPEPPPLLPPPLPGVPSLLLHPSQHPQEGASLV